MNQKGISDKFRSAYDACQEHFDECACDDNEDLLYDYVGRDEKESEIGITYTIKLQRPGSIIGKVPSISYDWAELFDEVESWYESYIEIVKEASDIHDFNDKVIDHGFQLFLTNRKSVYSDSITAGKFTHFAGRSIELLGERGYDVNKLNELYEKLEILKEELP